MATKGLKKEAVKLQKILNHKYSLDINYTTSLRIMEELKNIGGGGNEFEEPVKDNRITVQDSKASTSDFRADSLATVVDNLKNIKNIKPRSKKKSIYFNFNSEENFAKTSAVLWEELREAYGETLRIFLSNFTVTEFTSLDEFINQDEEKLKKLLDSTDNIIVHPNFFTDNEELFTNLIHELSKDNPVFIVRPPNSNLTSRINGLIDNFENYYRELYGRGNSNYYILRSESLVKDYNFLMDDFINKKVSKYAEAGYFINTEMNSVSLGYSKIHKTIHHWSPSLENSILINTNKNTLDEDIEYFKKVMVKSHFGVNGDVEFIEDLTLGEIEELAVTSKSKNSNYSGDPNKKLRVIILKGDEELVKSEKFTKIMEVIEKTNLNLMIFTTFDNYIEDFDEALFSLDVDLNNARKVYGHITTYNDRKIILDGDKYNGIIRWGDSYDFNKFRDIE